MSWRKKETTPKPKTKYRLVVEPYMYGRVSVRLLCFDRRLDMWTIVQSSDTWGSKKGYAHVDGKRLTEEMIEKIKIQGVLPMELFGDKGTTVHEFGK